MKAARMDSGLGNQMFQYAVVSNLVKKMYLRFII